MRRPTYFVVLGIVFVLLMTILTLNNNGVNLTTSYYTLQNYYNNRNGGNAQISCYSEHLSGEFPDVLDDRYELPRKGNSIFFHETSCSSFKAKKIVLNPRQACAVESAAKMNPELDVYLLFASPIRIDNSTVLTKTDKIIRHLLTYKNVHIRRVNFEKYTKETPLEEWYFSGALHTSEYPVSHASDVLRFLSLWRWGGTYLDLDVVIMKSLGPLKYNYAGAESATDVAAGVLNFQHDGYGHRLAEACLRDLRYDFSGTDWGHNGPGVITRILQRTCGTQNIRDMNPERCKGFNVLPPSAFYPIPWRQWGVYFAITTSPVTMQKVKDSYAIHVWNKHSIAKNVTVGSQMPYGLIAEKFCPKVYKESGKYF